MRTLERISQLKSEDLKGEMVPQLGFEESGSGGKHIRTRKDFDVHEG